MNSSNLKFLLVDDEKDICKYTALHLKRKGYNTFVANSPDAALSLIKEQDPDIMLLDVNMPKMSGIDMLKIVRQFNDKVKVIMITGYDVEFQKDPEFQKLNVFDVMLKPVSSEALDLNIERLLK